MGRAPRRGSLATTSGRPATMWRLCAGGTVADVTMSLRVRSPGWDIVWQRYRDRTLQLQGGPQKRAGGREGGRARLGRGDFYPRLIAATIDDRRLPVPRAAASPAWIRHCPRASPRSGRRRESTRKVYVDEDIVGRARCRPPVDGEPPPASAGCAPGLKRRRAGRSARRRRALPASSGRPASPGCSVRGREPW